MNNRIFTNLRRALLTLSLIEKTVFSISTRTMLTVIFSTLLTSSWHRHDLYDIVMTSMTSSWHPWQCFEFYYGHRHASTFSHDSFSFPFSLVQVWSYIGCMVTKVTGLVETEQIFESLSSVILIIWSMYLRWSCGYVVTHNIKQVIVMVPCG